MPNFIATKDTWVLEEIGGAGSAGNGKGPYMSVGRVPSSGNDWKSRCIIAIPCDFGNSFGVESAFWRGKVAQAGGAHPCFAIGSSVRYVIERLNDNFAEGDYAGGCSFNQSNGTVWSASQGVSAANRGEHIGTPALNSWVRDNITAMLRAFFDELKVAGKTKGILLLRLAAWNGLALGNGSALDEENAARRITFFTVDSNNPSFIEANLITNRPPRAPLNVTPSSSGGGPVPTGSGTRLIIRGTRSDPDAPTVSSDNDWVTGTEPEVWTEDATDDDTGAVLTGSKIGGLSGLVKTNYTGQPITFEHAVDGFTPGQRVRFRVRTRDRRNVWGTTKDEAAGIELGWTRLADGHVLLNAAPRRPRDISIDQASTTPDIRMTHDDPDGDPPKAVGVIVTRYTAQGPEILWNATGARDPSDPGYDPVTLAGTGEIGVGGGDVVSVTYGQGSGSPKSIVEGDRIGIRLYTVDIHENKGAWAQEIQYTVGTPTGPTNITPRTTAIKQASTTPLITVGHNVPFDRWEGEAYTSEAMTTQLMDVPETPNGTEGVGSTSYPFTYGTLGTRAPGLSDPPAELQNGQNVWHRYRVREAATGRWTGWTPPLPFYINALPRAPLIIPQSGGVRHSTGAYWTVPTTTPRLYIPIDAPTENDEDFDPDRGTYADAPSRRIVQVYASPRGASPVHTSDISSGITDYFDMPAGVLPMEGKREVRARWYDDTGGAGPWSDFLVLKASAPPVVGAGTAPAAADPTPTIDWTYSSSKPQAYADVLIDRVVGGSRQRVHSARVVGTETQYKVPKDLLETGWAMEATVIACDTDWLCSELKGGTAVALAALGVAGAGSSYGSIVVSPWASDAFNRTVVDGWGNADQGGAWTVETGADADVNGTRGLISTPVANASRRHRLLAVSARDVLTTVKVQTDKLAVGGAIRARIFARYLDLSNGYFVSLLFNTDQTLSLVVQRLVGGATATLQSVAIPGTHLVATDYTLKFEVAGTNPTVLRAKAWRTSEAEPGAWQIDTTDSTASLQVAGPIGLATRLDSAVTNAPVVFSFEDFVVS